MRRAAALGVLLLLSACAGDEVAGPGAVGPPQGLDCVPYARQVSGIDIHGDAWTWWDRAEGRYARGSVPVPGAVLVMRTTPVMPRGHLAVVETVVDSRDIRVTQANWGNDSKSRGRVETGTPVVDVSPDNTWRAVRVWNRRTQAYGRVNPAYGFIYPRGAPAAPLVAQAAPEGALCPAAPAPEG
ncbi:MAG: CHAP domain-containing protein [Rhodospirillaceae bacterium]|nr:CHAP domain-containing protein [Rhodospirillaceae bacterium]